MVPHDVPCPSLHGDVPSVLDDGAVPPEGELDGPCVGALLGVSEGTAEALELGETDGLFDGPPLSLLVGLCEGSALAVVGCSEVLLGEALGVPEGTADVPVGAPDGRSEGEPDAPVLGETEGWFDGPPLGVSVGL